jgi:hypothetical protein
MKGFKLLAILLVPLALLGLSGVDSSFSANSFQVGSHTAVVKSIDSPPLIKNEFSSRFKFDSFANPKLKQLRDHYKLDEVIAPATNEFDQQIVLLDWTHRQFKKFGRPSCDAKGALDILKAVDDGHTFFCAHYAQTFVSCAASLGWLDRELALRRHQGAARNGTTEHSVTEIWSNQHRKWIMLDPTSNMYLEKNGIPLNAWEIRQEWFYNEGKDLVFSIGKERNKYRKSDLPIKLARFADFGDLTVDPDELDKYGFIGYIPNTNLMDAGPDYGAMFISKDKLCNGTQWHTRTLPPNPALDPYFPINQSSLTLHPAKDAIRVSAQTFTPNFRTYEVKIDDQPWKPSGDSFSWSPHPGSNSLQTRTVNLFGIAGPVSTVVLELSN